MWRYKFFLIGENLHGIYNIYIINQWLVNLSYNYPSPLCLVAFELEYAYFSLRENQNEAVNNGGTLSGEFSFDFPPYSSLFPSAWEIRQIFFKNSKCKKSPSFYLSPKVHLCLFSVFFLFSFLCSISPKRNTLEICVCTQYKFKL